MQVFLPPVTGISAVFDGTNMGLILAACQANYYERSKKPISGNDCAVGSGIEPVQDKG